MPRKNDPARPVGGRPGIPAGAAGERRRRGRVASHGGADRTPSRGDHPGCERDVPAARCRRPRRARRRPGAATHDPRSRRGRRDLPTPRAARVAADERRRVSAGRSRTRRRCGSRAPSRRGSRPASTRCSATRRSARTATRSTPRPRVDARPASGSRRSTPAHARPCTASPRRPRRTPACSRTSRRVRSSPGRRSRSWRVPNRSIR